MRTLRLVAALIALAFSAPTVIEAQGFIPQGYAAIDHPTTETWLESQTLWRSPYQYIAGWAFDCAGSEPTIVVWRWEAERAVYLPIEPIRIERHLRRPDVRKAFASWPCVVPEDAGFHVYLPPQPHGAQAYVVGIMPQTATRWDASGRPVSTATFRSFFALVY